MRNSMMKNLINRLRCIHVVTGRPVLAVCALLLCFTGEAQINSNGCVAGGVGINATLYANGTFSTGAVIPPAGNVDWFKNATGRNIINQTNSAAIQTLLQNNANPIQLRL
jgi:hypothetical protein